MKQLVVLIGCTVVLLGLVGCQNPAHVSSSNSSVEVIIEGGGQFPKFLVGKWKADKDGWEIVFEPDGTISSAVINLGRVRMNPGQIARFPTRYGGKGVFEPGQWLVHYTPETRELTVKVVIEYFHQDIGDAAIGGNSTDILAGTVSKNGTLWWVEWFTVARYVAYMPEPKEFENMKEPRFRNSLVFEKVTP